MSERGRDIDMEHACEFANIPTLLLALVHLTGDPRWLEPPYAPTRPSGLDDNDTGGLPISTQAEIRAAAAAVLRPELEAGAGQHFPQLPDDQLVKMLAASFSEPVPNEYGPMIAAGLGLGRGRREAPRAQPPHGFRVIIIGAGISGICAGYRLKSEGIPFTILEKNARVGGTWLRNRYPGCGVDTPSHLYEMSFAGHDWQRYFALRDELLEYLEGVSADTGLTSDIQFNVGVERAWYDAAEQRWHVDARDATGAPTRYSGNILISAVGAFAKPKLPDFVGLDRFAGPVFHSADWPAGLQLSGERVGLIGNGASAMQIGPAIVDDVASISVFQRSPQWAAPFGRFHQTIPRPVRHLLSWSPLYRSWYRVRLGWSFNDRVHSSLQKDPGWPHSDRSLNATNEAHRQFFERYLRKQLSDRPELVDQVLPRYPPFGKRMLLDNGWYRMLTRPNAELVTDQIARVTSNSVITTDGRKHPADILVLATGFDVVRFLASIEVTGRSGQRIRDEWGDDDARAYLGVAVPGFPNFFCLYGPNTQTGHGGSLTFISECQVEYIVSLLRQMFAHHLGAVECRRPVHDAYNAKVDAAHEQMVWTHPAMSTYYRNRQGRVVVNSPFRVVDIWHMTRRADLNDYDVEPSVAS